MKNEEKDLARAGESVPSHQQATAASDEASGEAGGRVQGAPVLDDYRFLAIRQLLAAIEKDGDAPAAADEHEHTALVALKLARRPTYAELVADWKGELPSGAEYVFPPSADGGHYSVTLGDVGALFDKLREVAGDESPAEAVGRMAHAVNTHHQLREALKTYGQHQEHCPSLYDPRRVGIVVDGTYPCTCGFAAALAASEGSR